MDAACSAPAPLGCPAQSHALLLRAGDPAGACVRDLGSGSSRAEVQRVVWRPPVEDQNGNCNVSSDARICARKASWMRFNAAALSASKRSTSTGVVLDA